MADPADAALAVAFARYMQARHPVRRHLVLWLLLLVLLVPLVVTGRIGDAVDTLLGVLPLYAVFAAIDVTLGRKLRRNAGLSEQANRALL